MNITNNQLLHIFMSMWKKLNEKYHDSENITEITAEALDKILEITNGNNKER